MTKLHNQIDEVMVKVEGGEFAMGSEDFYPDEAPVRRVSVDGFQIDPQPVTNSRFSAFEEATGFVTEAEKPPDPAMYPGAAPEDLVPGGLVFTMTPGRVNLDDFTNWWRWTPGADWRHPTGPESSIEALANHPVVQVSHGDAAAYCEWAGLDLPTEAEWEFAARGGLDGARFAWGDEDPQETEPLANTWQGRFPYENTELDGWTRTSPVGSYPSNGYGLFDMTGNVWEWTDDWYTADHPSAGPSCCAPPDPLRGTQEGSFDPGQEIRIPRKVVKGGSHLCTPQYCYRYRPAARQPQTIETATSHLGFRGIRRS
ncbi:MAG: formylglycine-generating enzyme family protein [Acidimicrobiia bacterium]